MHRTERVPVDEDRLGSLNYMTVGEATQLMRIGRSTLYRLAREGHLPLIKIGTRSLIRRQDVDDLMAASAGGGRRALRSRDRSPEPTNPPAA